MEIKTKLKTETAKLPVRSSDGAAGYDLYADIDECVMIRPGETVSIPSHLAMEIPIGYAGLIFARSGLSSKQGLRPATCVSVIDSDYRGWIGLPLHNDSAECREIKPGDRICQLVIVRAFAPDFIQVEDLSETVRGTGGFGSTGK